MANKRLFGGASATVQATDAVNEAGGNAYALGPKAALAQLAVTGCLSSTYYTSEKAQLDAVVKAASACDPEFVGKVAIYAREKGFMKDMPAFLCAYLATVSTEILWEVFPRVIDNGKMLRNFVQIIRSGALGRKSFGTGPRNLIRAWFGTHDDAFIFRNSIGAKPSMADVLRLIRPLPETASRSALYAYMLGKESFKFGNDIRPVAEALPPQVQAFIDFKADPGASAIPDGVPYEMLEGVEGLTATGWSQLAGKATWSQTRQHLNTFLKHGVFNDRDMTLAVAAKLANPAEVKRAKCFPYQLLSAYVNVDAAIPTEIKLALQDAMEVATLNVPKFEGRVVVCPDVSGSMRAPVTGQRGIYSAMATKNGHKMGDTSKVRCLDVAALVSACVLRANPMARVLPFEEYVVNRLTLNPRDSVMTNAQKLASIGGGSTNCSAPLAQLNGEKDAPDVVIFISDYESWVDSPRAGSGTAMLAEWQKIVKRNPKAKMVCIDVTPYETHQLPDRPGILRIGGFSDTVFSIIAAFLSGEASDWISQIETIQ